jgi:signal transduction histidine kinase
LNKLWVRISLTYIAIVIILIVVPSAIFVSMQADGISPESLVSPLAGDLDPNLITLMVKYGTSDLAIRLIRNLFIISLMGMLIGVLSSRGLAAPLNNLAKAARAVGSQDLSQRIEVEGTNEIREVVVAFNNMAEALEEAEGLRNNMLADIAHELRTPLTVIQGNLRAILDDVYDLDKVEVARLYDQTRQLSRLVEDLHDLSLLEAKEFSLSISSLNVSELVQTVLDIYQPIYEEQNVQLSAEMDEDVPALEGDTARLTQCLTNLLNNALRHTPEEGEVKIKVWEGDSEVTIAVCDNGEGIDSEHLPYVFDRFCRVDSDRSRQTGGTGLGLAITQALVQAHGGKITVESDGPGKGSQFTITLPVFP